MELHLRFISLKYIIQHIVTPFMIFYYFFKNLPLKTRPVIFIDFLETLSYFYSQYLLKSNVSIYYVKTILEIIALFIELDIL